MDDVVRAYWRNPGLLLNAMRQAGIAVTNKDDLARLGLLMARLLVAEVPARWNQLRLEHLLPRDRRHPPARGLQRITRGSHGP